MATSFLLTNDTFSSLRHTTHYWQAGPADGPLMIFFHGWPEIGLVWRAQMEASAIEAANSSGVMSVYAFSEVNPCAT